MNMGYEEDELKPHIEPESDYTDLRRIGTIINLIAYNIPISFWLHNTK